MAERAYVQLTKDENSLQNITPGELNQPIDVVKLTAPRCESCGQTLPESYQPPANEDWSTRIFACDEDNDSCWTGLFCPCVLFGHNVESLNEDISFRSACVGHAICVEGGITIAALTAGFHGLIDPSNVGLMLEGLFCAWWMCSVYTGMARQSLQRKYHLKDSPCDPSLVHCCLHWCAICQEHREMKNRLPENTTSDTTMTPPEIQNINAYKEQEMDRDLLPVKL